MNRRCWTPLGPSCAVLGERKATRVRAGRFNAIAIDPSDPTGMTVYAGSAAGGLWKTSDGGVHWVALPIPRTGRAISALLVDPTPAGKFLFVGTGNRRGPFLRLGVGVLISPDDGASWDPLPTGFVPPMSPPQPGQPVEPPVPRNPLMGAIVNALAIDPAFVDTDGSHLRIWAGTDRGLFVTAGRGRLWTLVQDGDWTALVFSQGQLIGARVGGVFRIDGNDAIRLLGDDVTGPTALAQCASHPSTLYAALATQPSNGLERIVRSDDGGATWEPRELPSKRDPAVRDNFFVAVHPSEQARVYLTATALHHTFDGATTADGWARVTQGTDGEIHALAFSHALPHAAWIAASNGVYTSPTEGLRGPPQPPPDFDPELDDPPKQAADWRDRKRGLATMCVTAIAQHPRERSIVLGAASEHGLVRCRAHPLWSVRDESNVFSRVAIDPNEPTTWYAAGMDRDGVGILSVRQSKDSGETWSEIHQGLGIVDLHGQEAPFELAPLVVDPSRKGIVYLGTKHLYRWDDAHREAGWVKVLSNADEDDNTTATPITAIAVAPSDSRTIYIGTRKGVLLHLQDLDGVIIPLAGVRVPLAGVQVSNQTTGFPPISSIAVFEDEPAALYVTTRTAISLQLGDAAPLRDYWLFRSTDGGFSWRPLELSIIPEMPDPFWEPPEGMRVNKLLLEHGAPHRMFLATDEGVLTSRHDEPFDPRWRRSDDNLPTSEVFDLALFPPGPLAADAQAPARVLRVATIGRGVWERALLPVDEQEEPAGACERVDVFVRDNSLDTGEAATPAETRPDPTDPGDTIKPAHTPDIKLDRPSAKGKFQAPVSNHGYLPADDAAAVADYIGFGALARERPQADVAMHAYLQVLNRGPSSARIKARLFYARADIADENPLPDDPFASVPAGSTWRPVGDALERDVPAGEPAVLRWTDWRLARDFGKRVRLAALVAGLPNAAGASDPLPASLFQPALQLSLADKHIALREVDVLAPPPEQGGFFRWWMIPAALAVAYLVVDVLDIEPLDALDLI